MILSLLIDIWSSMALYIKADILVDLLKKGVWVLHLKYWYLGNCTRKVGVR